MIKCLVGGLKKDPLNVTSQYQQLVVQQAALTAEKDLNKTISQVNMAGVFSRTTKQMLKNVIRHTNSHNKVVDEVEMWQQYDRMKELGGLDPSNPSYGHDDRCDARSNRQGRTDYWNGRSAKADYPSTSCRYRRAHMDEDIEERGSNSAGKTSTYWMRQLEKFESSNPNRWDHSGFREMYPDDFKSDRSDSSSEMSTGQRKKRKKSSTRKKKKHRSRSRKHRAKDRKSAHRRKKRAAKYQSSSSDSDTDSGSDTSSSTNSDTQPRKRHHKSKEHHHHKSTSRNYSSSDDSTSSDLRSESDSSGDERLSAKDWREKKSLHCSGGPGKSASFSRRKKVKIYKAASSERAKYRRKKSKKHKKKRGQSSGKKHKNGPERENQLVVEMWKGVYGPKLSPSSDAFDERLQKEIGNQYKSLKRKYLKESNEGVKRRRSDEDVVAGGESQHEGKRRRRRYSESSSSDSD